MKLSYIIAAALILLNFGCATPRIKAVPVCEEVGSVGVEYQVIDF